MSEAAIPAGWDRKPIKAVAKIATGDKDTKDRVDNGLYPFFVRSQTVERINSVGFDGEGVLTAGDGVGTGKIFHYINGKCDFHQRVYLMHSFSEGVTGRYFFYYFSHFFYDRIMAMTAKSSVDSVRREMIADMEILFPNDSREQERVVAALSDADGVVAGLERVIAKKRLIKQGAMQDLLTARRRLPGLSGEWEVKKLGTFCRLEMGGTPSRLNASYWGKGHPWLTIADMQSKVITSSKEQVTDQGAALLTPVKAGTLIMSFKLSIGRLAFAGTDLFTNEAICSFNDLAEDADFLFYALSRTDFALYGKQAVKGYTLNKQSLKEVEVLLPRRNEQQAIAAVLSDMDAEIQTLESRLAKARAVKEGMMQTLLTGRVRLV